MITSDRINVLLEKVGSPHRALPGALWDEAIMQFIEALPAYIEKRVEEAVAAREGRESQP